MNRMQPTPPSNATPVSPTSSEPLLLRAGDAAKLLAISPRKLWQLTNMGEVPVMRIGRSLRYPREELRAWIAGRRKVRS
jgi:excisionase family DNA binding protein